jgi:hypothetical protein
VRETLTNLLDALALLLLAGGLGCQAAGWTVVVVRGSYGFNVAMLGLGLFVAGATVLAGSWIASRPARGEVDQ